MILKKTLFPSVIFEGIDKKDAIIAVVFFIIYFILSLILLRLLKNFILGMDSIIESKEGRRLIVGLILNSIPLLIILIILKIRNQGTETIGIRKKGLLSSLGIGLGVIAIITIVHIMTDKDSKVILMNLIFFVLAVGFGEEIVFRGFIWPRLVVGFGKVWGTVISGMMFGAMHAPMKIIINESPFIPAITNALGGGVVASLIFIYIYTRNNNIVLPSFIHGALDFMQ